MVYPQREPGLVRAGQVMHGEVCTRQSCDDLDAVPLLQAVLDDMALELLPAVAGIAGQSDTCCASMIAFFTLAASSCAPRDMLTAVLEVTDGLLDDR